MPYRNTVRFIMPKAKIAISMDESVLGELDRLVRNGVFANRSRAIEAAVRDELDRRDRVRLAAECAKLDPALERELAEEGLSEESAEWPEY
ncbi:MAG: ribbon-helix-helix domain-containing protein [Candidatus Aminicenantales bacterium]